VIHIETLPGGRVIYPWYEREKRRLGSPVIVAQELDIDTDSSAPWPETNLDHRGPFGNDGGINLNKLPALP
jgi:hypothetical protein